MITAFNLEASLLGGAFPFGVMNVEPDSAQIRKEPSDRDCPPDAGQSDRGDRGKEICKKYPCAQGNDSEDYRNSRFAKAAEQAIEKE